MNPAAFVETVRSDNETALSRLGSSKALYAATAGEMDAEVVLATAATAAGAAGRTFAGWADEAAGDSAAAFSGAAAVEERRHEAIAAELGDGAGEADGDAPAAVVALWDLDGAAARAGGYLGWALVTRRAAEQFTGFFVGQADPQTAQLFRGFGGDLDDHLERGRELLEAVCDDESDREAARDAAGRVVRAAYDEYTETLEGLGVNPKPVC